MLLSFTHCSDEMIVKTFENGGYKVISNDVTVDNYGDPWYTITIDVEPITSIESLFATLGCEMSNWFPNHPFNYPSELKEWLDKLIKHYSHWDALEDNINKDDFVDFLVVVLEARKAFDDNDITDKHIKCYTESLNL